MSRPTYETSTDRNAETRTITAFSKALGCGFRKLEQYSAIDYALLNDQAIVGWAEIKCRSHVFGTFPTYMLSLHKWRSGIGLSEFTGLPFFLVVGFQDGIYYLKVESRLSIPVEYGIGGRRDRNDTQDREPVVWIAMSWFTKLAE